MEFEVTTCSREVRHIHGGILGNRRGNKTKTKTRQNKTNKKHLLKLAEGLLSSQECKEQCGNTQV